MLRGQFSEHCAPSNRNTARDQIGTPSAFTSESAVEILSLVLQHDEQAVLCAVELALEAGVPTKTHVLNILHRLTDGKAPPASPIDAPQALRLAQEPLADVGRYDNLRELRHAS